MVGRVRGLEGLEGYRVADSFNDVVLTLIVFDIFGLSGVFVNIKEDTILSLERNILVVELADLVDAGLELVLVVDTEEVAYIDLFVREEVGGACEVDTALAGMIDELLVVGFGIFAIAEHPSEAIL